VNTNLWDLLFINSLYQDLTYRNPFRRLLILSYDKTVSVYTTFQAGEPELYRFAVNKRTAFGEKRPKQKKFLWRCNDEWLVSQV